MTTTTIEHGGSLEPEGDGHGAVEGGGHHETRAQRHFKERLALWLLIGGDALFLLLELFTWFYLRALNTNGMWRGAACTKANACTDGLGNPITSEIPKAGITYTLVIAALTVVVPRCSSGGPRSRPSARRPAASSARAPASPC